MIGPIESPTERAALVRLVLRTEPSTQGLAAEVDEFGPAEAERRLLAGHGPLARGSRLRPVPTVAAAPEVPGARLILIGDPEYPTQLTDLDDPPLVLWVRGQVDLRLTAMRSVAVVGARAASAYGQRVAGQLGAQLAQQGWAVVSGAAFGIDAAAHRGALSVAGPTIAVLACGVDVAYPKAHDTMLAAIAEEGALVSELPPGAQPLRFRFLSRNRIIAALTRGTVVVEAAMRSGAVATANRAHDVGRPVMAVPGPVDVVSSAGTNRMLHDQSARAVRDGSDVVGVVLGPDGDHPQPTLGELPAEAQLIAGKLSVRPMSVGKLAASLGQEQDVVLALLGLLELLGAAKRVTQGWVRGPAASGLEAG